MPELSLHLHSAVVTTLCKRCSHIAAMCTNIINCFSKSHFSCACLPSYDITGRQFEWFKIVKSKSQQLNSSQLNVCPGWGGGCFCSRWRMRREVLPRALSLFNRCTALNARGGFEAAGALLHKYAQYAHYRSMHSSASRARRPPLSRALGGAVGGN